MQFLGREEFIRALESDFPDVAADIDPDVEGGLLHLEMAALARSAQAAIDSGNKADVRRHFAFADDLFRRAGPELKNALYVSYLEHLNFRGHRAYAEALLPPALHSGWVEINEYLEALFAEGEMLQSRRRQTR
jgi:hypothetical protein